MDGPKEIEARLQRDITAWETDAASATFAGKTLAQFKTAVQPSFDARQTLMNLIAQLRAAEVAREEADKASMQLSQQFKNAVLSDSTYGPDSALYESMGYVRTSKRKSGMTRKSQKATAAK